MIHGVPIRCGPAVTLPGRTKRSSDPAYDDGAIVAGPTQRKRQRRGTALQRGVVGVGFFVACLLPGAAGAHPGDLANRRQLQFDVQSAYWIGALSLRTSSSPSHLGTQSVGVVGFPRIPISFAAGYAPSDRWVLGARLELAAQPQRSQGRRLVSLDAALVSYLELTFMRDRNVRPFGVFRAGVGGSSTFLIGQPGDDPPEIDQPFIYPLLGVGLGTHAFVSEDISLDATIIIDHRWNARRGQRRAASGIVIDVGSEAWSVRDTSLVAGIHLGFSRWF